jgi:hypothetical protein
MSDTETSLTVRQHLPSDCTYCQTTITVRQQLLSDSTYCHTAPTVRQHLLSGSTYHQTAPTVRQQFYSLKYYISLTSCFSPHCLQNQLPIPTNHSSYSNPHNKHCITINSYVLYLFTMIERHTYSSLLSLQ